MAISTWGTCPQCGGEVVDAGTERTCLDCGAVEVNRKALRARRLRSLRTTLIGALVAIVLIAAVIAVVVLGVMIEPPAAGEVEGSLSTRGGPLGDLTFAPIECFGAERIVGVRFSGVALLGSRPDTKMIRLVRHLHHRGALVKEDLGRDVIIATRTSPTAPWQELKLTPKTCPGLMIELGRFEPQPDHDTHTDRYRGKLAADCAVEGGGRIKMAIRFDHCRCNWHLEKRSID